MKIVQLTDIAEDGDEIGGFEPSDREIYEIYDIGEYDSEDGYVQFIDRYGSRAGWYIGCADVVRVDFDDGSSIKYTGLRNPDRSRNCEKISAAIAELRRIVFSHDNEEDNYSTDMPDIF